MGEYNSNKVASFPLVRVNANAFASASDSDAAIGLVFFFQLETELAEGEWILPRLGTIDERNGYLWVTAKP